MPWRQVLVAIICTSLTVRSSPCSWVEVLSSWSQGYKAAAKLQMEETVDHWDVDVEFSERVINFEAWKGHVNKISDTSYSVSNTCYNNMVYSCQCFELPYLVRHEPMWVGNTTFKFNGDVVPACDPPFCDDSSSSGEANTTSTTSPADNQATTETEINSNLNVVNSIFNDLTSLGRIRYKRQSNGFTKDENELLDTLAEYTTYLKNECSTISGNCQSKTLATYGLKLNAIIQKIKKSGGISSGFLDAFKEKRDEVIEATETADRTQSEKKEKICMANGRPCIFPFKDDAGKEHNTCANYKGRYLWCATGVNSKGTYISWEKCPKGGRCEVPNEEKATTKKTTTTTTTTTTTKTKQGVSCMAGSKPCVFPFKNDDGTEHNECADYKGRYLWCATAINSKGTYTTWGKCTECKDPNTSPSTPGDCSCTDYINKKGYGDCKKGHPDFNNAEICYVKLPSTCSDLRESKTDPGKMASAEACKKDDSCCQEIDIASTGIALEHQGARLGSYKKQTEENDGKSVYLQEGAGGNYLFYRETFGWLISRQGPKSSSEGGIMSDSEADCPTDGGMKWKIYDRVTYDNIDSTFKLTCKGSHNTVSNPPTKPPGSCLANGKPCIFPFKDDDGTSYNGCPKYEGRYYWCATSLKTNGMFKVWEHCPEDGSCRLLNNDDSSTPAALPKPTTKPSESPETTPSVKWERGTTSFYISDGNNNYKCEISFEFNANKKTEFKDISSTCSESKTQEDVMQYVGKHNFTLISKEGATLECFIGAAIARGDLCQTVLEDSLHCDAKSGTEDNLRLVCPDGYSEKSNAQSLYLLKDWTYNEDAEDVYVSANICATECKQNKNCDAVVSTVCKGCQLLTKEDSVHTPRKEVNHYCLYATGGKTRLRGDCPEGADEEPFVDSFKIYWSWSGSAESPVSCMHKCQKGTDKKLICKGFYYDRENKEENCILIYDSLENENPPKGMRPHRNSNYENKQKYLTCKVVGCPKRQREDGTELKIYTVPVGQGDSTIIKCPTPNDHIIIIDIGKDIWGRTGVTKDQYKDILSGKEAKLKHIFLTHPDQDHINYLKNVMTELRAKHSYGDNSIDLYIGGTLSHLNDALGGKKYIQNEKIYNVYEAYSNKKTLNCGHYDKAGTSFIECGFRMVYPTDSTTQLSNEVKICDDYRVTLMAANYNEFKFHGPTAGPVKAGNENNRNSLVMKVTPKDISTPSMLMMGDFESLDESIIADDGEDAFNAMASYFKTLIKAHSGYYTKAAYKGSTLKNGLASNVLMVPHHGSYKHGNGMYYFFKQVAPSAAIFSGDPFHGHGHPHCDVLKNVGKVKSILTTVIDTNPEGDAAFPAKPTGAEEFSCRSEGGKEKDIYNYYIDAQDDSKTRRLFQTIESIESGGHRLNFIKTTLSASMTSLEYIDCTSYTSADFKKVLE